jgi:hypothetical protein
VRRREHKIQRFKSSPIHPALSQPPCVGPQQLQCSTPPRLTNHATKSPKRSERAVAGRSCSSMTPDQPRPPVRPSFGYRDKASVWHGSCHPPHQPQARNQCADKGLQGNVNFL